MGNGCVLVGSKEKRTKNYSLGISSIQRIAGGGGGGTKKTTLSWKSNLFVRGNK